MKKYLFVQIFLFLIKSKFNYDDLNRGDEEDRFTVLFGVPFACLLSLPELCGCCDVVSLLSVKSLESDRISPSI